MRLGCWLGLGAAGIVGLSSIYGAVRLFTTFFDYSGAASELPAAAAEYQRNGLPFVATDLVPGNVPQEQNVAVDIRAAIAKLPPKKDDDLLLKAWQARQTAPKPSLAKFDEPLKILSAAEKKTKCDFQRDWDLGPFVLLPEYANMKRFVRAATLRAWQETERGDDEAAIRDLELSRKIALWAGEEPTLIAMLVRIACETITLEGAEGCLDRVATNPTRLEKYRRWLQTSPPLPDFAKALRGEAFLGVATSRNLMAFGGTKGLAGTENGGNAPRVDPRNLQRSGFPKSTKLRAFMARHLQFWNDGFRVTSGFTLPPGQIGRQMDEIEKTLEHRKGLSYTLESIVFPVLSKAGDAVPRLAARQTVKLAFAEALITHAQTGQWPTSVKQIDPFTGKPLKVKITGQEFRVYSVDQDLQDNGGIVRRETKNTSDPIDEAAVYPPVKPRKKT